MTLLEKALTQSTVPSELLANSVITFMVKGLLTHLEFPYAYFPSRNVSGNLLFPLLWEALSHLESNGFKVSEQYIFYAYVITFMYHPCNHH